MSVLKIRSMNSSKGEICTFVFKYKINLKKIINFFSSIQNTNEIIKLSDRAFDFYSDPISKKEKIKIRKFCYKNKIDICIQNLTDRKKKILFSDMDATIIKNETLDDLVKIAGTKLNIDETSKLAMEGKISLEETLSVRVNHLKGKSVNLIEKVLKKIKFSPGSKVLINTLNDQSYYTCLLTGGFEPISTFVKKKLSFKNCISNRFILNNKKFTGKYVSITGNKNSKLFHLNKICRKKKFQKKDIISIGDGANDVGMLTASGLGIGYNAHQIVRKKIENQIFFTDLTTVLFYLGIKERDFSY